jgi:hypothetical protein
MATSEIVYAHRNAETSLFMCLRPLIAGRFPSYNLSVKVEADESYFGRARRSNARSRNIWESVCLRLA